jgi:hypothetical protein
MPTEDDEKPRQPPLRGTRGIRAIRFEDHQEECERRLAAFGLFARTLDKDSDENFALRVARALRAERKAARGGGFGYDPMRHLVLIRLNRRLRRRRRNPATPVVEGKPAIP